MAGRNNTNRSRVRTPTERAESQRIINSIPTDAPGAVAKPRSKGGRGGGARAALPTNPAPSTSAAPTPRAAAPRSKPVTPKAKPMMSAAEKKADAISKAKVSGTKSANAMANAKFNAAKGKSTPRKVKTAAPKMAKGDAAKSRKTWLG